jgi:phosphatidate cytidylyltransferase
MLVRIRSGIVAAVVYGFILFLPTTIIFAIAIGIFSILGVRELYRAVRKQGGDPNEFLGIAACGLFQFAAYTHHGASFTPYQPVFLLFLVLVALLSELFKGRPKPTLSIGATLLGGIYVGWLSSYVTLIHGIYEPIVHLPIAHTTSGEWLVFFVSAATWLSDSGALFFGKGLGRHKMAPNISPQKTWEGSIGGILMSLIGGALIGAWIQLPLDKSLPLALICGVFGQLGDLCESALKRDLGLKDFGDVIPGHGGILDRIDSILFAAPLAYYFIWFFIWKTH